MAVCANGVVNLYCVERCLVISKSCRGVEAVALKMVEEPIYFSMTLCRRRRAENRHQRYFLNLAVVWPFRGFDCRVEAFEARRSNLGLSKGLYVRTRSVPYSAGERSRSKKSCKDPIQRPHRVLVTLLRPKELCSSRAYAGV
jgi:hypothetical protein